LTLLASSRADNTFVVPDAAQPRSGIWFAGARRGAPNAFAAESAVQRPDVFDIHVFSAPSSGAGYFPFGESNQSHWRRA
jgi:hypothetical protein